MTGHDIFKENKETYRKVNENEEEYDMCQALRELREDFINMGREEGLSKGEDVGKNRQQCYTIKMMLNKNYDLTEICSIAGCDPDIVEKVREKKRGKGGSIRSGS